MPVIDRKRIVDALRLGRCIVRLVPGQRDVSCWPAGHIGQSTLLELCYPRLQRPYTSPIAAVIVSRETETGSLHW